MPEYMGAAGLPRVGSFGAVKEGEWGANDDTDLSPLASQPFSAAFAQRSVEQTDVFVLKALGKGGDGLPGPQLDKQTVAGELDALSMVMGALWELAAESDVNQARAHPPRASHTLFTRSRGMACPALLRQP